MIELSAELIGDAALKVFSSYRFERVKASLVSYFNNSINLEIPYYRLLTFTTKTVPSPFTIIISKEAFLLKISSFSRLIHKEILKHYLINLRSSGKDKLTLAEELTINLKRARIYQEQSLNTNGTFLNSKDLLNSTHFLNKLAYLEDKEFSNEVINAAYRASREVWRKQECILKDLCALPYKVKHYIGLGEGFTPSYDDFLGSFIGVINKALNKLYGKPAFIMNPLDTIRRTNRTSALLLFSAARGMLIKPLFRGLNSFFTGNAEGLKNALLDLTSIGHTSGIYMGLGLIVGLEYILNSEGGENSLSCSGILKKIFRTVQGKT